MSVNPDMSANTGVAEEFVDLEHQVIRQRTNITEAEDDIDIEVLPGSPAAEFDPGERQLDREEIAQLVVYRRSATLNFLDFAGAEAAARSFALVDASVGINGDLFRPVTTQDSFQVGPDNQTVTTDTGGEIGLLDNYQVFSHPQIARITEGLGAGGSPDRADLTVNFYDYPTGGPIVDSFDTITCGFSLSTDAVGIDQDINLQMELRYEFWWDVAEQGRSTNPFGRPSTR
jgi:hypothetical protein